MKKRLRKKCMRQAANALKTNYDSNALLKLEQIKLKEMLKYFQSSKLEYDNNIIIRDIKLALSLLDIIENEGYDKVKIVYDLETDGLTQPGFYTTNYDIIDIIDTNKVNFRNAHRFYAKDLCTYVKPCMLLTEKAWHLYNKLRLYKLRTWWD